MRKADKLFQLINLVRTKQPITAREIAEELGVSVRSVYRYIDDLSVNNIPIYGTTGIGYRLYEQFELPPLNLTEKELEALVLGVKMVRSWTGDILSESAKSLGNKIEAVLPKRIRDEYSDTIFTPDIPHNAKNRKVWELLHQAIKDQMPVSFEYQSLSGEKTTRTVYPLGLLDWGGKWTLGSWCTLRKDFRDFRLDRFTEIKMENEKFTKDHEVNLEAYLASIKIR